MSEKHKHDPDTPEGMSALNDGHNEGVCMKCQTTCPAKEDGESVDWEEEFVKRFWVSRLGEEANAHVGAEKDAISFIRSTRTQAVKERDEFWKAQEMGKSSDCAKHERQAVEEYKKRLAKEFSSRKELHQNGIARSGKAIMVSGPKTIFVKSEILTIINETK